MYVRLIQFVQVFAEPGKNQLCEMFKRAAGIVVKSGSNHVDLILPVLVVAEGEKLLEVIPVPERMSEVFVQIKGYSSSVNLTRDTVIDGLNKELDYITLLMEMKPADSNRLSVLPRDAVTDQVDDKRLSVAICGLLPDAVLHDKHPLRDKINHSFDALMTESFGPEKIKGSSEKAIKNVKLSLGVVYHS